MEPQGLTYRILEKITNGFSENRKIGQGSYGTVYKGVRENGEEIAVKKLNEFSPEHNDMLFENEFRNLRILKHQNVVRFVAYCYETKHEPIEYKGKVVLAERRHRAFCLEYLPNGSFRAHLADFGLSKIFCEGLTRSTRSQYGTLGYRPPEYIESGLVSKKFDIFSLGVVIIKIVNGLSGYEKCYDMSPQEFVDFAQRNWRLKLQSTCSGSLLEAYCQQVKRCTEIALNCLERDRNKRPTIGDIIDMLNETEHFVGDSKTEGKLGLLAFYKNVSGTSKKAIQFHPRSGNNPMLHTISDLWDKPLVQNAILASRSICSVARAVVSFLAHANVVVNDEPCARRGGDGAPSLSDFATVMTSLGLVQSQKAALAAHGGEEDVCGECATTFEELLESKVAREGELREAFHVFDRDEDGFVTAAELWIVMRRLGIAEGEAYEDCERMTAAFDGDGDGRISFHEFRAMMQNAA